MRRRHIAVVRIGIQGMPGADLFQVAEAVDRLSPLTRLVQRGQQHRSENGDDRDDDQQFNQGESTLFHPDNLSIMIAGECL